MSFRSTSGYYLLLVLLVLSTVLCSEVSAASCAEDLRRHGASEKAILETCGSAESPEHTQGPSTSSIHPSFSGSWVVEWFSCPANVYAYRPTTGIYGYNYGYYSSDSFDTGFEDPGEAEAAAAVCIPYLNDVYRPLPGCRTQSGLNSYFGESWEHNRFEWHIDVEPELRIVETLPSPAFSEPWSQAVRRTALKLSDVSGGENTLNFKVIDESGSNPDSGHQYFPGQNPLYGYVRGFRETTSGQEDRVDDFALTMGSTTEARGHW
jgi:hypothetical protein